MREKPKTIDRVLGKKEKVVTSEDIARLTEREILGLDEPMHELLTHEQSLTVPKIVRYLYETEDESVLETLLAHYGLNGEQYDTEKNPHGLFESIPVTTKGKLNSMRMALLLLAGVRSEQMNQFFGYAGLMIEKRSIAFEEAKQTADHQRETFSIRHAEQFPRIQKALSDIKRACGLDPEQLFISGRVSPAFPWQPSHSSGDTLLLDEMLSIVSLALTGTATIQDIAHLKRRSPGTIHNLLRRAETSPLSEETLAAIESKLKREKPGRRSKDI